MSLFCFYTFSVFPLAFVQGALLTESVLLIWYGPIQIYFCLNKLLKVLICFSLTFNPMLVDMSGFANKCLKCLHFTQSQAIIYWMIGGLSKIELESLRGINWTQSSSCLVYLRLHAFLHPLLPDSFYSFMLPSRPLYTFELVT